MSFLSRHVCHDKHLFVATKHVFCHDTNMLVVTNVLWRKNVCRNKTFVATKMVLVAALASHTSLLSKVLVAVVEGEVGRGVGGEESC